MDTLILLMGGVGSRMNVDVNKVLLKIGNKMMFEYSLNRFDNYVDEIVIVANKNDYDFLKKYENEKIKVTIGGSTRGESVYNGLNAAKGDYVLVHDAARPFVSYDVIKKILSYPKNEAVLTYLNAKDTIKIKDIKLKTLDRSKLLLASTPQACPKDVLIKAYEKAFNDKLVYTDDISLLEVYSDIKINLVLANEEIFKITTKLDLKLAEVLWRDFDD